MRSITIFILFLTSIPSFSQKEISNKTHPFQVLFGDSESYSENSKQLRQFDFLEKQETLTIKNETVLIHYSGELVILNDTILNLARLSKSLKNKKIFSRPIIDLSNKSLIDQYNTRICLSEGSIIIAFPNTNNTIKHPSTIPFTTAWRPINTDNNPIEYIIEVSDIYDNVLDTLKSRVNHISFDLDNYQLAYGLMIYTIYSKNNPDLKSFPEGVKILDSNNDEIPHKYRFIVDALKCDKDELQDLANKFYLLSIEESNQDPRFIQFYEDFLERNPQFK